MSPSFVGVGQTVIASRVVVGSSSHIVPIAHLWASIQSSFLAFTLSIDGACVCSHLKQAQMNISSANTFENFLLNIFCISGGKIQAFTVQHAQSVVCRATETLKFTSFSNCPKKSRKN